MSPVAPGELPAGGAARRPGGPVGVLRPLARAMRPHQWIKNLLVFAAPMAAGVVQHPAVLRPTAVAFVGFCLASSGIYLLNDVVDLPADRVHPVKSRRPVAAGLVRPPVALWAAAVLLVAALGLSAPAGRNVLLVLLVYEAVQVWYCLGMKNEPVIELVSVASGFLLRAVAGGVAAQVELTQWFLMTAGFGSLFLAAGKRYAEAELAAGSGLAIRPVLSRYRPTYLRFVWTLSAGVLITTYSLWAFAVRDRDSLWGVVSIVPLVIIVLRYAINVDSGDAGDPEDILLRDRMLLLMGAIWAVTTGLAVYGQ